MVNLVRSFLLDDVMKTGVAGGLCDFFILN